MPARTAPPAPGALANDLTMAGRKAAGAYGQLVEFLGDELAAEGTLDDAVGRDRYALWSREFVGAAVDLDETYEWGLDELARMAAEQDRIVKEIAGPGATIAEAIAKLESDPSRVLHGKDALQRVDAGDRRRGDRRRRRRPLRHPRADEDDRVHDRAVGERRHLLHRAVGRLHPAGTDVVVGAAGRHRVQHLAGEDHRLPRGRPRSSPADRAGRAEPVAAELVAPAGELEFRATAKAGRCTPSG